MKPAATATAPRMMLRVVAVVSARVGAIIPANIDRTKASRMNALDDLPNDDVMRVSLGPGGATSHRSHDEQEDDASDEGHDETRDVDPRRADVAEVVPDPAAENRTDDPDDEITQHAARPRARHDELRQPPGDDANDYPSDNTHDKLLSR